MPLFPRKRLFVTAAVFILSSTTAFAIDVHSFGERLQTALKREGVSLSFSSVDQAGDDVLIRGTVFGVGDGRVDAGDLRFEKVTGTAEHGFRAARLPIESFRKQDASTAWKISNLVIEDIQLAGTDETAKTAVPVPFYYSRFAIDEFTTSQGGGNDVVLTGIEIVNEVSEGGVVTSTLNIGNFNVDFSLHEPTDFLVAIEELGYQKFSGSASSQATWDPSAGNLEIKQLSISIEDGGLFQLSAIVTGVTTRYAESLWRYLEDEDPPAIAILGPLSHLALVRYHSSYEDASLAERLVDFYAKRENLPRDEVIRNASTILPPLLKGLENDRFQKAIGSAVADFLKAPKSKTLTASVQPERPIPGAMILGIAVGDPETLPDFLGVQVKAEQKPN